MKQRVFKKFDIRNVLKLPEINLARNAASRTNQMIKDANSTVATPPTTCARWIDQNCRSRAKATAVLTERFPVSVQAIDWDAGRRPRALAAYVPGAGRVPGFSAPLLAPSVLPGIELERLDDVAGLPAYAAPREEPWIYDGRAVLRARPRSGRRPT